jgi:NSS family neurotransmitter:Na+ symporter
MIFSVFPAVFGSNSLGWLWSGLFFTALAIAAITSGVALLEVLTSNFIDRRKWSRKKAVGFCVLIIFFLGLVPALSISNWHTVEWMQCWLVSAFDVKSGSFMTTIDYLSTHWLLPLCCLGISIFVGWGWGTHKAVQEIRHGSNNFADVNLIALMAGLKDDFSHSDERYHILTLASVWGIFIRFIAPVVIAIAFVWMNVR